MRDGDPETAEVYRYDPSNEQWEPMADFIGAPRQTAVAFTLMVAMLIWRPTGLFKGRVF